MIDIELVVLIPFVFFAVVFILRKMIDKRAAKPHRVGIPSIDRLAETIAANDHDGFYGVPLPTVPPVAPKLPPTNLTYTDDNFQTVSLVRNITASGDMFEIETTQGIRRIPRK